MVRRGSGGFRATAHDVSGDSDNKSHTIADIDLTCTISGPIALDS